MIKSVTILNKMGEVKTQLFREEALANVNSPPMGHIFMASVPGGRMLVLLMLGFVVFALLCVGMLEVSRKESAQGLLVPKNGLVKISASGGGTVVSLKAKEGDFVKEGQILLVLSSEHAARQNLSAESKLFTLLQSKKTSYIEELARLGEKRAASSKMFALKTQQLQSERRRLAEHSDLQSARIRLVEQNVAAVTELQQGGFFSEAQVRERKGDLLDQRQRLADLDRAENINAHELDTLDEELRASVLQNKADVADIERKMTALDESEIELNARRENIVRATSDGTISSLGVELGQSVAAGTHVAYLIPPGQNLEAEIYMTTRTVGFLQAGDIVFLRYHAFPFQKFGQHRATVKQISLTTAASKDRAYLEIPVNQSSGPTYRVRLILDHQEVTAFGRKQPLRIGMIIDASVILEKRRLYEWILEPLYTVGGRI